jgi:hypothetical protein
MQRGDRHSAIPGGRMLAKVRCFRHVPGTRFRIPWDNASHWLMQRGDRQSAVPGGRMLAKVRCVRHVPGTRFRGTRFRAPGAMLAIG